MSSIDIQCHCGAVAVRLQGEPIAQFFCHCDDCRTIHGAAYIPRTMYPASAVSIIKGEPVSWSLKITPRTFCSRCGAHLFAEVPGFGVRGVNSYLLPRGTFAPQFHLYCRHAVAPVSDGLPHFAGVSARFGGSDEQVSW